MAKKRKMKKPQTAGQLRRRLDTLDRRIEKRKIIMGQKALRISRQRGF